MAQQTTTPGAAIYVSGQLARGARVRPPALSELVAVFDAAAGFAGAFAAVRVRDGAARRDAARSPELAAGFAVTRLAEGARPGLLSCSASSASKPLIRRPRPNSKSLSVVPA